MPKLHSSKEIEFVLKVLGFNFYSQKGSHGKFKNNKGEITILPMNKKEIPEGTLSSILKQIGINKNEFLNIINK
jgi:predicted RNA binding protein YcfA (HicA-like mRNA interferase family)